MSIIIPKKHHSNSILKTKDVFVIDKPIAIGQNVKALRIGILNLMPLKKDTEEQFFRLIANTSIHVEPILLKTKTYKSKNTSAEYLNEFYRTFDEVKEIGLDGLIITGANVELLEFEEVDYWQELCGVFDWAKQNACLTLGVCWAAQAGLYHYYGIEKFKLKNKISGVYTHEHKGNSKLLRGLDDEIQAIVSRATNNNIIDIENNENLEVLVKNNKIGAGVIVNNDYSFVAVPIHFEYSRGSIAKEWIRNLLLGYNDEIPENYFYDSEIVAEFVKNKTIDDLLKFLSCLPESLRNIIFSTDYFPKDSNIIQKYNEYSLCGGAEKIDKEIIHAFTPKLTWRANAEIFYRNWINHVYKTVSSDKK